MDSIKNILIVRDGMTETEAEDLIASAKEALQKYLVYGDAERAYNICQEYFGLEPDYIHEFI